MSEPDGREVSTAKCCCLKWKEGMPKIKEVLLTTDARRGTHLYHQLKFIFCPWCGKLPNIKQRERATKPRRDEQPGRRKYDVDFKARAPKTENYSRRMREEEKRGKG